MASAKDSQDEDMNHKSKQEDALSKAVWDLMVGLEGEVEAGLLQGPFTAEQITRRVGELWVPA